MILLGQWRDQDGDKSLPCRKSVFNLANSVIGHSLSERREHLTREIFHSTWCLTPLHIKKRDMELITWNLRLVSIAARSIITLNDMRGLS